MAYQYLTMLDVSKINGSDAAVGLIEENLIVAPEAAMFPARTIAGTSFKTLIRSALPTSQFRNVNEGVEPTKSTYINKLVETFYLDQQMELDVAAAQGDELGEAHAQMTEADGHGRAALQKIGAQVWYGTGSGGDAKGFPGAVAVVDSAFVTDAGGTTANTGSSVYGVKLGTKFCELIFGRNTVLNVGQWRQQTITRASKEMTAWKNSLEGWIGASWVNKNALCRIKKLTADSGKGLTDTLLGKAISILPVGYDPDYWFMTKRSREQLRASRTATNPTGAPAPLPTDAFGIPIIITDSLLNIESLSL